MELIWALAFPLALAILGALALRFGADTRESGDKVVAFTPEEPEAGGRISARAAEVMRLEGMPRGQRTVADGHEEVAAIVTEGSPAVVLRMPRQSRGM